MEFPGGETTKLAANIIAKLMYAQCDRNGNKYFLWEVIIDHRKNDSALSAEDQKVVVEGQETIIKLIAGWDICCGWKDGSTLWEKLSNLKESHPI